ncbi:MAG: DUF434 domain-containing protein [Myxococcales bacterium]|nr:DUF434 domain-containing protein [Myxococcales bacterium]
MPDARTHRGPHPRDAELFGPDRVADLRAAVADLAWLGERGYAMPSALKLVGDRHRLRERQRVAVLRATCSDTQRHERSIRRHSLDDLCGLSVTIDGFNLLTTVEAALAGGVVLRCRDGCHRDMASMHGSYRRVAETEPAARAVAAVLDRAGVARVTWYLDRPVSNSGRLAATLAAIAAERDRAWQVELVADPDPLLAVSADVVATADSGILDRCGRWVDLASAAVAHAAPAAWILDLAAGC